MEILQILDIYGRQARKPNYHIGTALVLTWHYLPVDLRSTWGNMSSWMIGPTQLYSNTTMNSVDTLQCIHTFPSLRHGTLPHTFAMSCDIERPFINHALFYVYNTHTILLPVFTWGGVLSWWKCPRNTKMLSKHLKSLVSDFLLIKQVRYIPMQISSCVCHPCQQLPASMPLLSKRAGWKDNLTKKIEHAVFFSTSSLAGDDRLASLVSPTLGTWPAHSHQHRYMHPPVTPIPPPPPLLLHHQLTLHPHTEQKVLRSLKAHVISFSVLTESLSTSSPQLNLR